MSLIRGQFRPGSDSVGQEAALGVEGPPRCHGLADKAVREPVFNSVWLPMDDGPLVAVPVPQIGRRWRKMTDFGSRELTEGECKNNGSGP